MKEIKNNQLRQVFTRPWFFHPILFGIYPIIALLAANISQIRPEASFRPFLISVVLAVVVYLLATLIMRNKSTAAILCSYFFILFYSYGHIYELIEGKLLAGLDIGRHRYMGVVWLILLVVGVWFIVRKANRAVTFNQLLNAVSVVLVILPVFQIVNFEIGAANVAANARTAKAAAIATSSGKTLDAETLPDVYYIILDGYSRDDILKQLYDFDNTSFINDLKSLGFIVPDCAQSNYARTALSISSALHMDYVQDFSPLMKQGDQSLDMPVYHDYIQHSPVRLHLAEFGYKMVAFETGYFWNEVTDADVYIIANDNPLEKVKQRQDVSEFEVMFLNTTLLRTLNELSSSIKGRITENIRTPDEKHHDQVIFALDQLEQVPLLPGKKFVYAHILAPHAPFVFTPDGRFVSIGDANPGYLQAISYVNSRIITIVKSIIEKSAVPPVIIIQGDHGWDEDYRMPILNAYYLPNAGSEKIYSTISPINTFRTVFNTYFGDAYPLLKDVSYFSNGLAPYAFKETPFTCSSGNPPAAVQ
jgi:hypothetical protein